LVAVFFIFFLSFLFEVSLYDYFFLSNITLWWSFLCAYFLYYLGTYLALLIWLKILTKESIAKLSSFLTWVSFFVIFRPIIDYIILGNKFYQPFYVFADVGELMNRFFTYFGEINRVGVMYGTRVEVFFLGLLILVYVFLKRKKWWLSLLAGLGVYIIIFISLTLPSLWILIRELFSGRGVYFSKILVVEKFINSSKIFSLETLPMKMMVFYKTGLFFAVFIFLTMILIQYLTDKRKFFSLVKNIKINSIFFMWGLLFLGMLTATNYYPKNFSFDIFSILALLSLMTAVLCVRAYFFMNKTVNYLKIKQKISKNKTLTEKTFSLKEAEDYQLIFLLSALMFSLAMGIKPFLIILAICLLIWSYFSEPFNFKKHFLSLGLVPATIIFLLYFLGFILIAEQQTLKFFPWKAVIFIGTISWLIITIKIIESFDEESEENKITSKPRYKKIKNWGTKNISGLIVFFGHLGLVWILKIFNLFWLMTFLGLVGYWLSVREKKKNNYLGWFFLVEMIVVIGLVIFYLNQ